MRSNWRLGLGLVALALATAASARDARPVPGAGSPCTDDSIRAGGAPRVLRLDEMKARLAGTATGGRVSAGRIKIGPEDLKAASAAIASAPRSDVVVALPGGRTVTPAELRSFQAAAPAGTEPGAAPAPQGPGDLFINSLHSSRLTTQRRIGACGTASGASDYYAVRFATSQLARQLPFAVDGAWMWMEDNCTRSRNWNLRVVAESTTRPFWPDLASVVNGPVTYDSTIDFPTARDPSNPCACYIGPDTQVFVDFPADTSYPAASVLAVNDGTHNDQFTRPNEPLSNTNSPWLECSQGSCTGLASLLVENNRVRASAAGTALAWRFPVFQGGETIGPNRYVLDYVEDAAAIGLFNPDMDLRLTVDYDVTAGTRAGVFFRGHYDFGADVLYDYYYVYADRSDNRVHLDHYWYDSTAQQFVTSALQAGNLPATAGTLTVEVTGYDPVVIRVRVGSTDVFTFNHTDPVQDKVFRGDVLLGHVFGLMVPNGTGGEVLDNFRVERNADLFLAVKMPQGEQNEYLLVDASEESREYFATVITTNGTDWSNAVSPCTDATFCPDCLHTRNTMLAMQVRQPQAAAGEEIFVANNSLQRLDIPCCGCPNTDIYTCALANDFLDDPCRSCSAASEPASCATAPFGFQGTRPQYEVGQPVSVAFGFYNDHGPNTTGNAVFCWMACLVADIGGPTCTPSVCWGTGSTCGGCLAFTMGPAGLLNGEIPGLTTTALVDALPPPTGDGFEDGALLLAPSDPPTFTPTQSGDHFVGVWEFFDLNADLFIDFPNPDDYPYTFYVERRFTVAGCAAPLPYDSVRNSLRMAETDTVSSGCTTAGDIVVRWNERTPGGGEEWNLHRIDGRASLLTTLAPCASDPPNPGLGLSPTLVFGCNPWPDAPDYTGLVRPEYCLAPPPVSADVVYFQIFQEDSCSGGSVADSLP